MKTLFVDSVGGASGDMMLGALIGLGVSAESVVEALQGVVHDDFSIEVSAYESCGINGVRATVHCAEPHADAGHSHHTHGHHHRTWRDIRGMIEQSSLPEAVKADACGVFGRIAAAEGQIHGKAPDEVHFHEVGALDSIIDVVGCCFARHVLGVDSVQCGPLPLGCGTIVCQHGVYPCPAPATLELLKGMRVIRTEEPHELVTPTGAALLAEWVSEAATGARARVMASVYSFGQRTLENRPNVLRAVLSEAGADARSAEQCVVLEAQVDDSSPEVLGFLLGELLDAGALDAYFTPVQMKKLRPGVLLTVLCAVEDRERMTKLVFRGCSTFGVRYRVADRTVLERNVVEVSTAYGAIRVKQGWLDGECITASPEVEDCVKWAKIHQVALRQVYEAAQLAAREGCHE